METSDEITNFASLKALFEKHGINMRAEWIIYLKLKRERVKSLVGADILARSLKRILNSKTSRKFKDFSKSVSMSFFEASQLKGQYDEIVSENNDFIAESFFKKHLAQYLNILIRGSSEVRNELTFFIKILLTIQKLFIKSVELHQLYSDFF